MIEVQRHVNIARPNTNKDVFDSMAGGSSYLETFAGDELFNPTIIPQSNPIIFKGNYSTKEITPQLLLQEDYAEIQLMPVQIQTNESSVRVVSFLVEKIGSAASYYVAKRYADEIGEFNKNGNFSGLEDVEISEIAEELQKDDIFENMLEEVGGFYAGTLGKAIAGAVYDYITTGKNTFGANMVEHTVGQFTSLATSTLTSAAMRAIASPLTGLIGGMIIGAIIDEAVEVALGLDNHYGFGGDLSFSTNYGMNNHYDRPSSVKEEWSKFKNDVKDFFDLVHKQEFTSWDYKTDINNNISGAYNGDGRFTDYSSVTLGVNVINKSIQTKVDTSLSDDYFNSQINGDGGEYSGGVTDGGSTGGFGSAEAAAAGGHMGGF